MSDQQFIAIGDIHGCYRSMEAMLEKLQPYRDRTFVFIGDYIDRGPDSMKVIDKLIEISREIDCVFLRGNHEQMLLDAIYNKQYGMWMMNGGRDTLRSYGVINNSPSLPEEHLDFYNNTRMYYDTKDYFFVHAGISPDKTIEESLNDEKEIDEFLWERSHLNVRKTPWEKTIVFGHTPRLQPIQKKHMIGIDTGCVYERAGYGTLTAVKLPEEEFVQQDCID